MIATEDNTFLYAFGWNHKLALQVSMHELDLIAQAHQPLSPHPVSQQTTLYQSASEIRGVRAQQKSVLNAAASHVPMLLVFLHLAEQVAVTKKNMNTFIDQWRNEYLYVLVDLQNKLNRVFAVVHSVLYYLENY
jgi:hypothetical protein